MRVFVRAVVSLERLARAGFTVTRRRARSAVWFTAKHPPTGIRFGAHVPCDAAAMDRQSWSGWAEFSVARLVHGDNRRAVTTETDVRRALAAVAALIGRDVRFGRVSRLDVAAHLGRSLDRVRHALELATHPAVRGLPARYRTGGLAFGGARRRRRGLRVVFYDPDVKRGEPTQNRTRLEVQVYGARALRRWIAGTMKAARLSVALGRRLWAAIVSRFPSPARVARRIATEANERAFSLGRLTTPTETERRKLRDARKVVTRNRLARLGVDFAALATTAAGGVA